MTRVLLVEEDARLLRAMARDLTRRGFTVSTAGTVTAAAAELGRTAFDVLITNLRMRGFDGIDLLTVARESEARVIVMSAYADDEAHRTAIDLGALQILRKPFHATELHQVVSHAAAAPPRRRSLATKRLARSAISEPAKEPR